jgi:hypothetical protein
MHPGRDTRADVKERGLQGCQYKQAMVPPCQHTGVDLSTWCKRHQQ